MKTEGSKIQTAIRLAGTAKAIIPRKNLLNQHPLPPQSYYIRYYILLPAYLPTSQVKQARV